MTLHGQTLCRAAMWNVREGQYTRAIILLRAALQQTTDRRAWSKLMLAIRELGRVAPNGQ